MQLTVILIGNAGRENCVQNTIKFFSRKLFNYSYLRFYVGAWFKQTRTYTADKTRRTRSAAQSHGDALLKSHPAPVHPDRCRRYNPQFVRATPRRSVRLSVCLSRKLGLEISFRLRCTSYLLHAGDAPVVATTHRYKKQTRAFFALRPPDTLPVSLPGILLSFLALPCNSFRERTDAVLIERPEIKRLPRHYWRNSIDRTMYFTLSRRVSRSRRWVDALRPFRFPKLDYLWGNPTCLPAATWYFVTKLISRVDISSARTDQDEGGSVSGPPGYRRTLRAAKAAPVRNGVTAITRRNLRREILSLQGTCIKFQTCSRGKTSAKNFVLRKINLIHYWKLEYHCYRNKIIKCFSINNMRNFLMTRVFFFFDILKFNAIKSIWE